VATVFHTSGSKNGADRMLRFSLLADNLRAVACRYFEFENGRLSAWQLSDLYLLRDVDQIFRDVFTFFIDCRSFYGRQVRTKRAVIYLRPCCGDILPVDLIEQVVLILALPPDQSAISSSGQTGRRTFL
jgi:hypothetical protein